MDEFDSSFVSGKYVAIISINSSATKYFGPEMISNMNDKDHLVGQLTTPKHTCAWKTLRHFFSGASAIPSIERVLPETCLS